MSDMSKVRELPDDVRGELDQRLAATGFRNYRALADWLKAKGFEIGKSSVQRYGKRLESRLASVKVSTEAARAIAAAAPDDADHRSAAVMSLIQTELFNTLVGLEEAREEEDATNRLKILSRVTVAVSQLARASVNNKRWESEVRLRAEAAATKAQQIAKKGGLSADAAAEIRRAILGIATADAQVTT